MNAKNFAHEPHHLWGQSATHPIEQCCSAVQSGASNCGFFQMSRTRLGLTLLARCFLAFFVTGLTACSATSQGFAAEPQILVKLARPTHDAAEVVRLASRATGVPVRYVSASSMQWHTISLVCQAEQACDDAVQKLRLDPSFMSVESNRRAYPLKSQISP